MGFPKKIKKPIPLIAVPSTTGTGSEVAFNASFVDSNKKIKMGINSPENFPVLSILDPKIVNNMPKSVLKSSGADLIVHTLESFMSTQKTVETEFLSLNAFTKIDTSLKKLLVNKGSIKDWENVQWACVWSMIAMANSSAGPSSAFIFTRNALWNTTWNCWGIFLKNCILTSDITINLRNYFLIKKI